MNFHQPPADTPLLLALTPAWQAQVGLMLRASGGAWSSLTVTAFDNVSEALREARSHPPHALLPAVIMPESFSGNTESSLLEIARAPNLAPLILTDDAAAASAARAAGLPIIAPQTGLSPGMLADQLSAAYAYAQLRQQKQHLQQQYEMAETRFRDMADQFADWLWEIDTSLKLTFSSSRKRPAQGATQGSLFTACFLPEERLRIEDDFAELIRSPRGFHERDYWAADPYGTRLCWSVSGTPVFNGAGQLVGFRGLAQDVSPSKIATDQLYYLTNHDPLTGLANRHRFADELTRTLRISARENRTGALVLLDLDKFNLVNHSHGHAVGDKALVHVAQILKDHVRTNDLVARLDGDQFGLILRDVRPADLPARLERLQATLAARALPLPQGLLTLQASGGIAYFPDDAGPDASADILHANALDALTGAKQRGPNRLESYNSAAPANAAASERLQWVEFIHACMANPDERVQLHFQPIIPLVGSDSLEFYEALLRLKDDTGRLIPAIEYITIIEEFGIAPKLDRLVASRAVQLLQTWQQAGRQVRLSVNLSARTFDDASFLPEVLELLKTANLPQGRLVFELTETALLKDLEYAKTFISSIRSVGAGFALDDCGVGYSSLNYLRELELDYVKIDGAFIRNLHKSPEDQAVVKALAAIAKQKRIATIAEMVEHSAALDMLKTLDIDFGQGFYFAPPGPSLTVPEGSAPPNRW